MVELFIPSDWQCTTRRWSNEDCCALEGIVLETVATRLTKDASVSCLPIKADDSGSERFQLFPEGMEAGPEFIPIQICNS